MKLVQPRAETPVERAGQRAAWDPGVREQIDLHRQQFWQCGDIRFTVYRSKSYNINDLVWGARERVCFAQKPIAATKMAM
jgi:hypothetical protein